MEHTSGTAAPAVTTTFGKHCAEDPEHCNGDTDCDASAEETQCELYQLDWSNLTCDSEHGWAKTGTAPGVCTSSGGWSNLRACGAACLKKYTYACFSGGVDTPPGGLVERRLGALRYEADHDASAWGFRRRGRSSAPARSTRPSSVGHAHARA